MRSSCYEATNNPGGQIRLTAQNVRRKEMIGIIDWRMSQCERLGVKFKFNTWAELATVQARGPGRGDRRDRGDAPHRRFA
jgi:hypothetical protein